jgi:hypothetical protein
MEKSIEPWGVNLPFIILSMIYWALGGLSLIKYPYFHPYFMMIGTYSLFFGMLLRLFFPARKYFPVHILSLIFLAIPFYPFQSIASAFLLLNEIWGLRDIKHYGSRFPLNLLVLASPFSSLLAWSLYPFYGYFILMIGLLFYLFGINIGVFTATAGAKPKFGIKQLPIFILIIISFYPKFLFFALLGYFIWLFYDSKQIKYRYLSVSFTSLTVTLSSIFLGEEIHAFALGIMAPFFFNCIVYSTSRYNYEKVYPIPYLLLVSYFLRFINLEVSSVFFIIATLYFLYLIKDNFTIKSIKVGMSSRYL